MKIQTEKQITTDVARTLREQSGLTQKSFWESVGSNQTSGHWFETGKRKGIPRAIRMMIFMRYVAMLPFDFSTPDGAQAAVSIANEINAKLEAALAALEVKKAQARAAELSKKARQIAS